MKKVIVTTSIYPPNEVLQKYDQMSDWTLVVAGDLKTPKDFKLERGIYISPEEQEKYDKKLSDAIGWNCIMRRNFAFLWAKELNADIIYTTDDDNIQLPNWGNSIVVGQTLKIKEYDNYNSVFDPISVTNHNHLWHRGFPIQLVNSKNQAVTAEMVEKKIDIQANFWNGDPDIDAIERFIYNPECNFESRYFPFTVKKMAPFNSQNTFVTKEVLPHYCMWPGIGRADDIFSGLYAQHKGCNVGYFEPTVYQDRNPHNLTKNMEDEYYLHSNCLKFIQLLQSGDNWESIIPERTLLAKKLYEKHFE